MRSGPLQPVREARGLWDCNLYIDFNQTKYLTYSLQKYTQTLVLLFTLIQRVGVISNVSSSLRGLLFQEVLHVILVIGVDDERKSSLQNIPPIGCPLSVVTDIHLVADLATHDFLSEQIADGILKITFLCWTELVSEVTKWNESRNFLFLRNVN